MVKVGIRHGNFNEIGVKEKPNLSQSPNVASYRTTTNPKNDYSCNHYTSFVLSQLRYIDSPKQYFSILSSLANNISHNFLQLHTYIYSSLAIIVIIYISSSRWLFFFRLLHMIPPHTSLKHTPQKNKYELQTPSLSKWHIQMAKCG